MINTLKNISATLENDSVLEITNQNFSNEILLQKNLYGTILEQVNLVWSSNQSQSLSNLRERREFEF